MCILFESAAFVSSDLQAWRASNDVGIRFLEQYFLICFTLSVFELDITRHTAGDMYPNSGHRQLITEVKPYITLKAPPHTSSTDTKPKLGKYRPGLLSIGF